MAEVVGHDRRVDRSRCHQLVAQYEALYGPLPRREHRLWAGLRPMTADGTPIIGATRIEGLYLNTGHGTYGWTLACGSARLLADTLAGRPGALAPADYALDPALRSRQ
jgi:D-amino-acid dehydrogenase